MDGGDLNDTIAINADAAQRNADHRGAGNDTLTGSAGPDKIPGAPVTT